MTSRVRVWLGCVCLFSLSLMVPGCTRGDDAPPAGGAIQSAQPPSTDQSSGTTVGGVSVEFQSEPDPPRTGENTLHVTVKQTDGSPVTDATVTVVFSMAAMPSMNMPAMRSTASLAHEGSGRYSGTGELSMGGTWNVAVTVSRGPEELGRRNVSVIAK